MVYDLTEPIAQIFDKLEILRSSGAVTHNDYSDMQLIKFTLQIIKNTDEFEHDIRLWNTMLRADKTWVNLKNHFEHAHQSLRTTRGKTMRSMAFQHKNMIATQVLSEVKAVKEDVIQAM